MKFCNLVKLVDQYCGNEFQPCRGFQYEVTEASKWPELFHVKGSLSGSILESTISSCQIKLIKAGFTAAHSKYT